MNDSISRQAAIDALEREKTYCTAFRDGYTQVDVFEKYNMGLTDGIKALKQLPSAEPDIIRCHECAKRRTLDCPMGITVFDAPPSDGYCYKAERRNNA